MSLSWLTHVSLDSESGPPIVSAMPSKPTPSLADGRAKLGAFRRFDHRSTIVVLSENVRNGVKTTLFLHTPNAGSETSDTTTIAAFASPDVDVPEFELTAPIPKAPALIELAGDLLAKALRPWIGGPNPVIRFPGRERFHQHYAVNTTFAVRIMDVFTPRALDFLESHPGWCVEGKNDTLLVFHDDVQEPPERLDAFLAEAAAVAEAFRRPAAR